MKKSIRVLSLYLFIPVLLQIGCGNPQPSAEEMRKLVADQLPAGSSKAQVTAFLESRGIRHSGIEQISGYDEERKWTNFRIMTASISRRQFWVETSKMLMVFYFDDSERLIKCEVKETYKSV